MLLTLYMSKRFENTIMGLRILNRDIFRGKFAFTMPGCLPL